MMLEDGPVPAKQIKKEAAEAGHSERTLIRAKQALGIEAKKDGKPAVNWRLGISLPKDAKHPEECHGFPA
jgi:hypothetical protein